MEEQYKSVPGRDFSEDSIDDSDHYPTFPSYKWSRRSRVITALNIGLFALSCTILMFSARPSHDTRAFFRKISPYSTILDSVPIQLQTVEVQGTLFNDYDPPIIYRQPPSVEVDKAWDSIAEIEYLSATADDIRKLGKDPKVAVQIPEHWGLGTNDEPVYFVELDVQHQLHCLNEIRKYAYFEHYYGHSWANISMAPRRHQAHLSHCLHIILQALTCQPSMDVISHVWMETQRAPYPDFNINRQCVAHKPILKWQHEHGLTELLEKFGSIERPESFVEVAAEPSVWQLGEDQGVRIGDEHEHKHPHL